MANELITVEVVYALPDKQRLITLQVPQGTTVREAARRADMPSHFPGLDVDDSALGIFGKAVARPEERVVQDGDRIEIYRPLIADPKEVRKQRAARAREKAAAREDKAGTAS